MRQKWTGERGGLAVSGHPFLCGLCKREEGIESNLVNILIKIEK